MPDRICTHCGEAKPSSEFHRDASRSSGRHPWCKPCRIAAATQWVSANRDRVRVTNRVSMQRHSEERNARARLSRQALRRETILAYGGVCACCGESEWEFLAIDHINGGGNQHRRVLGLVGPFFFKYLRDQGFPVGYQVLCHNCNQAKGAYGTCPHTRGRSEVGVN